MPASPQSRSVFRGIERKISFALIAPTVLTNAFTNGVWTGSVSGLQPATNVMLQVNDMKGHKGTSNPFYVQPAADLGLTVSSQIQGPPPLRTGMRQQFNLTVTNRGPSDVPNVVVHSTWPSNLTLLAVTNLQGSFSNFTGGTDWILPLAPKGSNFTAELVYRADSPGNFTNEFDGISPVLDLNAANNFVAVSNHVDPPLLNITDASGTEVNAGATGMVFKVTLSGPSAQTIAVDYFTVDGTASNGLAYHGTNGTVSFAPGTTNAAVTVYAIDDILHESNRSFSVLLTNAVNGIISDGTGAGTVIDDDPPPAISIPDVSVVEGDTGTTNAVFLLTMNKPAVVDVTVRCTTATNTASTNDFIGTNGTVTFPAGSTNATFSVPVLGDTVNEPDETYFVILSLPANATISRGQAIGIILNDDTVPGRLDHFGWGAIGSPQYSSLPLTVTLRALDYAGNPASNGITAATVVARTEHWFTDWLKDDFEDGATNGWTNFNASFTGIVTNVAAAQGSNSLQLTGGAASLTSGLRHPINNSQPDRIVFSARVGRTNQVAGRFTAYLNGLYRVAVFYFNNNGQMGMVDGQGVFHGVPYQSNQWYQVDLTIHWGSQTVDCRTNGALALSNISFPNNVSSMDAVLLANQDNTTSWWDNIQVYNDSLTNTFAMTPNNFSAFVNGADTNSISITGAGTNVYLYADDGLQHVGQSGFFDLLPVNLTLVTPASMVEGNAPTNAQVYMPVAFPGPVTVNLTSSAPARLTMPSSVVIPAKQSNVTFSLGMVDDNIPNWTTPVYFIATGTNVMGVTNVISLIDNDPAPGMMSSGRLADGRFQLMVQGPPVSNFVLMASSNLMNWDAVSNLSFANWPILFLDPASTNLPQRFYRLAPYP